MDTAAQLLSEEERSKVYDQLADMMIVALETGQMFTEDANASADYIKEQIETVQTRDEMLQFLLALSSQWEVYKKVALDYKKLDLVHRLEQGGFRDIAMSQ